MQVFLRLPHQNCKLTRHSCPIFFVLFLVPILELSHCISQADVILVLDSSSSVKFNDFQLMKSFAADIVSSYNIRENGVRVALVAYSKEVDPRFHLNDYYNLEDILDAIDNTQHEGRGTFTGQALQHVLDVELGTEYGAREGVPTIVIAITVGRSKVSPASDNSSVIFSTVQISNHTSFVLRMKLAVQLKPYEPEVYEHMLLVSEELPMLINLDLLLVQKKLLSFQKLSSICLANLKPSDSKSAEVCVVLQQILN